MISYEIFENKFFTEHLQATSSAILIVIRALIRFFESFWEL